MQKLHFVQNPRKTWLLVLCAPLALLFPRSGGASAPAGHFVVGSGEHAGTVADTVTGLTWMRAPIESSITWTDATTYCADLTFAGYSDWRLPTVKEFQTIIDETRFSPALDTDAFPAVSGAGYWSSTAVPWDSTQAALTDLNQGSVGYLDKMYMARAICLR